MQNETKFIFECYDPGSGQDRKMGFYYDWDALANFYNLRYIDQVNYYKDYKVTLLNATSWIIEHDPEFTFIYIGYPDEVGHKYKWGSEQYLRSLEDVDTVIGDLYRALKHAGMYENTHIIVVTDHGGIDTGHGEFAEKRRLSSHGRFQCRS